MRGFLAAVVILLSMSVAPVVAEVKMDETTRKATARALEWLVSKQNTDGSWSTDQFPHNTAITSFTLLAFMSQGHLPNRGQYGPEVARGCRFLLGCAHQDGFLIGSRDSGNGNMYCHAMATLALAELYGMTGDDSVKPVLEKAVDLIVRCQSPRGGWRYQPNPQAGSDISVTIMQVMALRAAKNSGLQVPDTTLQNAIKFIKTLYDARSGGFAYESPGGGPGFARSAAGICVLQLAGQYDAKEIPKTVAYLKANRLNEGQWFWYGHYYATHAMNQVGGKDWEEWYKNEREMLLPKQEKEGFWGNFHNEVGPVYQTAIGVIILSVPANYLPIFEH